MLKVAALAWMPINAVLFGCLVVVAVQVPGLTRDIDAGAWLIGGAAIASMLAAAPLAWWVAQRMVTPMERQGLDAVGGPWRAGAQCQGVPGDCRCCRHHGLG